MKAWILGQFETPEAMLVAGRHLRELGYADLDGYAPYPVHGLEEAFGFKPSRVPLLVLIGGLTGAASGYALQWWCNAVDWPINVGGKPFHSPWLNVPITFELGVLFGAFAAVFGLFTLLKLPRLHHPVFEVPEFRRASIDRFWISVCTAVGPDEQSKIAAQLAALGATDVSTVADPS